MSRWNLFFHFCAGLRKVSPSTNEDIAYNNALGDIFDYIIESEKSVLMPGAVRNGKWVRDKEIFRERGSND